MAGDGLDIIDLGERHWPDGWSRTRQVLPSRGRRAFGAVAVVAVVLIALAGSGRPALRRIQPLWTMPGQQSFSIGASNVYLRSTDGLGLLALAPETGQIRWRVPGDQLVLWSEAGDDLVFLVGTSVTAPRLTAFNTDPAGEPMLSRLPATVPATLMFGDPVETVIADRATGNVLTRHSGYPLGLVDGGATALLMDLRAGSCPAAVESTLACQFVVAVNVHTGTDLWSLPVPSDLGWGDADPDGRVITRVLLVDPAGSAVVHDAASGEVLASVPIGPRDTDRVSAVLAGDFLVTAHEDGAGIHVSSIRLDTGERVWTTTTTAVPTGQATPSTFLGVAAVGDLLVLTHDGVSTTLDPQTGRIRFEVAGDGLQDLGGGRLLVRSFDADAPVRVIDATTGATVGTYTGADVLGDGRGHLLVIRQSEAWATIALLDAMGREMRWDAVRGDGLNCQARADLFACTDRSGQLRVWRVPA